MSDSTSIPVADQQALIDESSRIAEQYATADFAAFAAEMDATGLRTVDECAALRAAAIDVEQLASARDRAQARYRLASDQTKKLVDRVDDLMAELNTAVDLSVSLTVPQADELDFIMTALGTDTEGFRGARFTLLTAAQELPAFGDLTRFHLGADFLPRLTDLNTEIRESRDSASVYDIRRQVNVHALHKRLDVLMAKLALLQGMREAAIARAASRGVTLDIPGFDLAFLKAAAASVRSVRLERVTEAQNAAAGM